MKVFYFLWMLQLSIFIFQIYGYTLYLGYEDEINAYETVIVTKFLFIAYVFFIICTVPLYSKLGRTEFIIFFGLLCFELAYVYFS